MLPPWEHQEVSGELPESPPERLNPMSSESTPPRARADRKALTGGSRLHQLKTTSPSASTAPAILQTTSLSLTQDGEVSREAEESSLSGIMSLLSQGENTVSGGKPSPPPPRRDAPALSLPLVLALLCIISICLVGLVVYILCMCRRRYAQERRHHLEMANCQALAAVAPSSTILIGHGITQHINVTPPPPELIELDVLYPFSTNERLSLPSSPNTAAELSIKTL